MRKISYPFVKNFTYQLHKTLNRSFWAVADFIFPPHSLLSDEIVKIDGTIEFEEWQKLHFHFGAQCNICATPLTDAHGHDDVCAICLAEPPDYDKARAPLLYDEYSKQLVLQLKHSGRKDGVKTFAKMMHECFNWDDIDLIFPMPLHPRRLFERGFNQSAWLANEISKLAQKPWHHDILIRIKNTKSQNGLSIKGRMRNMRGAFKVKTDIKGKNICIVDDVFTTGSSVNSCAKALKKAGANKIYVLTLLRVGRPKTIEDFEMEILNVAL